VEGTAAQKDTPEATSTETQYVVLRELAADEPIAAQLETLGLAEDTPVCIVLPGTFEGNVLKAAHEKHGDGVYGKFPARSFELKPVRVTAVVKVG
jgi:hypothetical protein